MKKVRLIARLDIKGPNLIKGIRLEGVRVIGDPHEHARRYYEAGIDEIIYMDAVASLYGRNSLVELVKSATASIFVPITVGGGLRSVEDVREILMAGADKVAINTAAVKSPELISKVASKFGSQCMVLSVEAKQREPGRWEVYVETGREATGIDVLTWTKRAVDLGAGEILLTSVDREGTRKGYDVDLIRAVSSQVSVPVIASGGMGSSEHLKSAVDAGADAVAMADVLHYRRIEIASIRARAAADGIPVRRLPNV
jgi:cyclase